MFTPATAPFGKDPSLVTATFFVPPVAAAQASDALNLYLVFTDETTYSLLGQTGMGGSGGPMGTSFCCTATMFAQRLCPAGVRAGGLIAVDGAGGAAAPNVTQFDVPLTSGARGTASFTVPNSGAVWLTTVACDRAGGPLPPGAPVEVSAVFRNPYGYLPGTLVGLLPWYGVLLGAYLLLLLAYAILMCLNASYVLPLQYMVLGVIVAGTLEMVVSLGTFSTKNTTGVPTPCNICPITSDYMAGVVLNVLKRAVSRVLLLAVAMGFGVLHPSLPHKVSAGLAALGLVYAAFGILAAVKAETSYDDTPTTWELPLFALDLVFLALIQAHHTRTTASLKDSNQTEKLRMYSSLVKVVMANVVAHILLTVMVLGIRGGHVALDWRALFVLNHFWDALYFLVLLAGAYIWAPGPTAYRYAWYAQPEAEGGAGAGGGLGSDGDEEAAEEGEVEVELGPMQGAPAATGESGTSSSSGGSGSSSGAAAGKGGSSRGVAAGKPAHPPGTFVISAEEEDAEEEEKRKKRVEVSASAAATPAPASAAAAADGGPDLLEESDKKRLAKISKGGKPSKPAPPTLPGAAI